MGELERQGWREVLAPYPVEDILEALEQIRKTPREFTGRPGAVEVTLAIDAIRAERARKAKEGKVVQEMRDLEGRAAAGEKFFGLEDLREDIRKLQEQKLAQAEAARKHEG